MRVLWLEFLSLTQVKRNNFYNKLFIKYLKKLILLIDYYNYDYWYTRWPILIYNPKYLIKYFIYDKMVQTKVDQDRGAHLTVPSIFTLRLFFKVNFRIFGCGFEKSGKFHVKKDLRKHVFCGKIKVKCLRNDQMPFFWIVLVFRGEQTFKMLHKSRWNVKVYITLTIMTFRSIFKVTWRSRRFFLDWTQCPDKFFL